MKTLLFVFAMCVTFLSCQKEEIIKPFPLESQEGKGSFACNVNDKIWLAENEKTCIFCPQNVTVSYDNNSGYLRLSAFKYDKDYSSEYIYVSADSVYALGIHKISSSIDTSLLTYCKKYQNNEASNYYTTKNTGEITITKLDTAQRIISGKFAFSAKTGNNILSISKGIFDVKYH